MCRIAGLWVWGRASEPGELRARLERMATLQARGGPDGEGYWLHPEKSLGLAHRRLAILDLSPAGAQPMTRDSLAISYNGEIYNFRTLRATLQAQGYSFRSETDTEVLLWGWKAWGPELLTRLRGMWAFALWDGEALWLVRDRFGVKPLFYAVSPKELAFASELSAILSALPEKPTPLPGALHQYLSYGFVTAPHTFYAGVQQVLPGTALRFSPSGMEVIRYWDPKPYFFPPVSPAPTDDEAEALLVESFQRRLVSDVPVGIFLSGGIDSSLVATLLARRVGVALPAFTLGFPGTAYDEAPWAQRIAAHLGLPHEVFRIEVAQLPPLVKQLPALYGQPFGDASALAVYVLAHFTRQRVKVVLSADGGDELFGGYVRHSQSVARLRLVGRLLRSLPFSPTQLARLIPKQLFHNLPAKLLKLTHFTGAHYGELVSAFPERLAATLIEGEWQPLPYGLSADEDWATLAARQYLDLGVYLPDDVLQKVDRATMAHGLEAREPFLDPELVELAGRLPIGDKVSDGRGKQLLRRVLARYVPPALWQRPKQGFAPPMPTWLRGPLAEPLRFFLESTQSPLRDLPLRLPIARQYYRAFLRGEAAWALFLWHLLVLGEWAEWYATISARADNLPPAKSAPVSDPHTS